MEKIKDGLDNFMDEIKRENPDANWGNLLTGIAILVLIAVFSIWYFGGSSEDRGSLLSELLNSGDSAVVEEDVVDENVTVVLEGEGIWHVAERVCGDGEAYNLIAEANGLSIWSWVVPGQELSVVCTN